jgi:hypothetical protein
MMIMFALPDVNTLTLQIDMRHIPLEVYFQEEIPLSGTIISMKPDEVLSLVMVVDADAFKMIELFSGLRVGDPFQFIFRPVDYEVSPGLHQFSFYAVDSGGTVSRPQSFATIIIAPSKSRSPSPVATASRSISQSPPATLTPLPAPTMPRASPLPVVVDCTTWDTYFDIYGDDHGTQIRTSFSGWAVRLRVWEGASNIGLSCLPFEVSGVELSVNFTNLTSNTLLVSFRIWNGMHQPESVDIGVNQDIFFDNRDSAPVQKIPGGMAVYSDKRLMALTLFGSPLVDDVATYWFGNHWEVFPNIFVQVNESAAFGFDTGLAFSWQHVAVPARTEVFKSFVLRFGSPDLNQLGLAMDVTGVPGAMNYHSSHGLEGEITSNIDTVYALYVVVNHMTGKVYRVREHLRAHEPFQYSFVPSLFDIDPGPHTFTLFAMDLIGTVSNDVTFGCTIIGPTKSVAQTVRPSTTSSPIKTMARTRSLPPMPTLPPAPAFPMQIRCAESANFELSGDDGDFHVTITYDGEGMLTRIRIGDTQTVTAVGCEPLQLYSVYMYTNITHISTNSVLMNFRFENYNETAQVLGIETNADICLDEDDRAPVKAYEHGFIIYSSRHAVTFVGRNAPMVNDVSTYWFGLASRMEDYVWTQVIAEYFTDEDSAFAWSWQNISLQSGHSVSRSAIMKFGLPDLNVLSLAVSGAPVSIWVEDAIRITATATSWNEDELALLLVLDDDLSCFWRIVHGMQPATPHEVDIVPAALGIHPGSHKFALYAVDSVGTIAQPAVFTVTVRSDRVPTRSRPVIAQPTRSRSVMQPTPSVPPPTRSAIVPARSESRPSSNKSPEETPSATETPTGSRWRSRSTYSSLPRTASRSLPPATWPDKIDTGGAGGALTPGAIVGIVIGVLVAVAIGVLAFMFIRERVGPREAEAGLVKGDGLEMSDYTGQHKL